MSTDEKYLLDSLTSNDLSAPETDRTRKTRRPFRLPAWILPLGLLLGFLVIFALLFGNRLIPAIPVKVAPVITIRSDLPAEVSDTSGVSPATHVAQPRTLLFQASGWIEPDPFTISVPTLVGGIVDEVYVLEGEKVEKGQKLAKLIDEDAILELASKKARAETLQSEIEASLSKIAVVDSRRKGSESSVDTERVKLAELEDKLRRLSSLPRGSIAAIELTTARLRVDQQKAVVAGASSDIPGIESELEMVKKEIAAKRSALREAEVEVSKAQLALDRHTIVSPMDGIVLRLHAAPGRKRMVHMDDHKSAYIVELFDPRKLQSRIDVPLSEAKSISIGQPVEMMTDLLPDVTLKGEVTRITGEADLQRNTLQVKVSIENPDSRLRPEMLVRGKFYPLPIPVSKDPNGNQSDRGTRLSIYVPEAGLFSKNQVWVVAGDRTAERRTLTLGRDMRDGHLLVLDGVKSGENVILPPHSSLKPGARIEITP